MFIVWVVIGLTIVSIGFQVISYSIFINRIDKNNILKNAAISDLIKCQTVKSYRNILLKEINTLDSVDEIESLIVKKADQLLISFNGKSKEL